MPGRRANARQAGHRAAFTGVRRPGLAALSLPPRAIDPSRRSKVTVAIHPSCHAQVFWRAGEAHKDSRYADTRKAGQYFDGYDYMKGTKP